MKAAVFSIALVSGLVASQAHAQGTVNFGNNNSAAITNYFTMARVVAGTTFRVALYYLPDGPEPTRDEMEANGVQLGASSIIQPAAGLYFGGTRTTPSTTPAVGFAWFQVRAWETAFGTSYEQARDNNTPIDGRLAALGTSNIIRVKTGDPVNFLPPGSLTAYGLRGFIVGIPEPSSVALAALGLGALLLFRRRK